ncbi:MAG: hypothetical protein ABIE94_07245 [archaeon]
MAILSDRDIRRALETGRIKIEPDVLKIGPVSVDLRVNEIYHADMSKLYRNSGFPHMDVNENFETQKRTMISPYFTLEDGSWLIYPEGFFIGETYEHLTKSDVHVIVTSKSGWARRGVRAQNYEHEGKFFDHLKPFSGPIPLGLKTMAFAKIRRDGDVAQVYFDDCTSGQSMGRDLKRIIDQGHIKIYDQDGRLLPAEEVISEDGRQIALRFSPEVKFYTGGIMESGKSSEPYFLECNFRMGELFYPPDSLYLGSTMERVVFDNTIMGFVEERIPTHFNKLHANAGGIQAGFDGDITLEGIGYCGIPLQIGSKVIKMDIYPLTSPAEDVDASRTFRGQRGATPSR